MHSGQMTRRYVCPECRWQSDTPERQLHMTAIQQWWSHFMTSHAPNPLIMDVQTHG